MEIQKAIIAITHVKVQAQATTKEIPSGSRHAQNHEVPDGTGLEKHHAGANGRGEEEEHY